MYITSYATFRVYILIGIIAFCLIIPLTLIAIKLSLLISSNSIQFIYIDPLSRSGKDVNEKFISVGLDDIVLAKNFKGFNTSDIKLIKTVKYLSPAYLRIGGNLADKLYFSPTSSNDYDINTHSFYENCSVEMCPYIKAPNYTLSGENWLKLNLFAKESGLEIIFDLNALLRFEDGSWDFRNAESLIKFSHEHNLRVNWELGNEPNSYRHKFNEEVNATQMAKDFVTLKNILNQYKNYKSSLLVGPDTTRLRDKESENYFQEFVTHAGSVVDSFTWHHYYFNGRNATVDEFLDPATFDLLKEQIVTVKSIVEEARFENKPIWLGETSSAYGGGAPGLSDRFVASFIWLDKLGLSAKMGLDVVVRQSIFNGHYAMLDDNYDPNPDWWISVIFKRLVGSKTVPYYTRTTKNIRFYCHCTNKDIFKNDTGTSITVFGMNLANTTETISIQGLLAKDYKKVKVYAFEFTSDNLVSTAVFLNGQRLLMEDEKLPKIVPKVINGYQLLEVPAYSVVFWVITGAEVTACSQQ